ncbi:MAG: hypothetical protein MZU95_01210 [Desulfomicrobium escambiense]|nr:hypothetical protein [Desulfomicrobium escambiense]
MPPLGVASTCQRVPDQRHGEFPDLAVAGSIRACPDSGRAAPSPGPTPARRGRSGRPAQRRPHSNDVHRQAHLRLRWRGRAVVATAAHPSRLDGAAGGSVRRRLAPRSGGPRPDFVRHFRNRPRPPDRIYYWHGAIEPRPPDRRGRSGPGPLPPAPETRPARPPPASPGAKTSVKPADLVARTGERVRRRQAGRGVHGAAVPLPRGPRSRCGPRTGR